MRKFLESSSNEQQSLVEASQLKRDHEAALLCQEAHRIRHEIRGRDLGMIFDETPRNGEIGCVSSRIDCIQTLSLLLKKIYVAFKKGALNTY